MFITVFETDPKKLSYSRKKFQKLYNRLLDISDSVELAYLNSGMLIIGSHEYLNNRNMCQVEETYNHLYGQTLSFYEAKELNKNELPGYLTPKYYFLRHEHYRLLGHKHFGNRIWQSYQDMNKAVRDVIKIVEPTKPNIMEGLFKCWGTYKLDEFRLFLQELKRLD